MHGCLAFESFRNAQPGSPIYRERACRTGRSRNSTERRQNGTLPQVCWVLPSQIESEHPGGPCSPSRGGDFTQRVLEALTVESGRLGEDGVLPDLR